MKDAAREGRSRQMERRCAEESANERARVSRARKDSDCFGFLKRGMRCARLVDESARREGAIEACAVGRDGASANARATGTSETAKAAEKAAIRRRPERTRFTPPG